MTVIKGVSPHADFYPMLSNEAIAELAADIKENGQRDPITVNQEGILLDGRNRLKACEMIGVDPLIEVYEGDDDGAFVRSSNERRHQAAGSRAMSTALSMVEDDLRNNGRWKYGSLKLSESGQSDFRKRVNEAGLILDYAADLADDVVSGKIALDAAYREAKAEKERQESAERRKIEAAKAEEEREAYATEYFANHPAAQEWLDSKPEGVFETARAAFAAYQEHDREARAIEEARRREEEEARRAQRDRIDRMGRYLEAFVSNFQTGLDMADHPERAEILDTLTPQKRSEFLNIENTYLKGKPE